MTRSAEMGCAAVRRRWPTVQKTARRRRSAGTGRAMAGRPRRRVRPIARARRCAEMGYAAVHRRRRRPARWIVCRRRAATVSVASARRRAVRGIATCRGIRAGVSIRSQPQRSPPETSLRRDRASQVSPRRRDRAPGLIADAALPRLAVRPVALGRGALRFHGWLLLRGAWSDGQVPFPSKTSAARPTAALWLHAGRGRWDRSGVLPAARPWTKARGRQ